MARVVVAGGVGVLEEIRPFFNAEDSQFEAYVAQSLSSYATAAKALAKDRPDCPAAKALESLGQPASHIGASPQPDADALAALKSDGGTDNPLELIEQLASELRAVKGSADPWPKVKDIPWPKVMHILKGRDPAVIAMTGDDLALAALTNAMHPNAPLPIALFLSLVPVLPLDQKGSVSKEALELLQTKRQLLLRTPGKVKLMLSMMDAVHDASEDDYKTLAAYVVVSNQPNQRQASIKAVQTLIRLGAPPSMFDESMFKVLGQLSSEDSETLADAFVHAVVCTERVRKWTFLRNEHLSKHFFPTTFPMHTAAMVQNIVAAGGVSQLASVEEHVARSLRAYFAVAAAFAETRKEGHAAQALKLATRG
mmetsp:Transcript_7573/g.22717  ORF Transcript_7573/g.22717 Transcript_7573/m.22717 type:complete len:367 (+) Transcript_7573:2-1102(+)